jgi:drug/metabolite transporter (DMT)-like permease
MDRNQRIGIVFILLAVLGYSFFPIFARKLQATGLPSLDIATWRFLFATPIIWLLVKLRGVPGSPIRLPRYALLAMGTLLSIAALCAFFAVERIPVSTFIVLFYSYPAVVALFSAIFGERLPLLGWVALGLTLVGVALTTPDFSAGLRGANFTGMALSLFNAVVVAVYFMLSSRLLRGHIDMARASAWSITGACLVFITLLLFRPLAWPQEQDGWLGLVLMACFSTVMPIFFLTAGIQKLGPTLASMMGTVEPILTTLLAVLLLDERLQEIQLLGAALIIGGLLLLQVRRSPELKAARTPTVRVEPEHNPDAVESRSIS